MEKEKIGLKIVIMIVKTVMNTIALIAMMKRKKMALT